MRIAEPIEGKGFFWLPSDTSNRFPGILSISESGRITVELQGDLPGVLDYGVVRLLGNVSKLGGVTLEQCTLLSYRFSNTTECILHARYALCGVLYEENENTAFSKVSFSVDGLSEWLSISGFTVDTSSLVLFHDKPLTVTYQRPTPIDLKLSESISIQFAFGVGGPTLRRTLTEVHIRQTAYVSVESREPLQIEDIMSLTYRIRNFFCFAIGQAVSIHSLTLEADDIRRESEDQLSDRVPIKVYCESPYHSEKMPQVYGDRMLFRYTDVMNDVESVVAKWIESYEGFKPTFDLFFASMLDRSVHLEVRFQWLTQALEALHRKMSDETVMSNDAFKDIYQSVVAICPENRRKWLEDNLRYANGLSLAQRIGRLIAPFREYFGSAEERKRFVRKVVVTRNYMAHHDVTLSESAAKRDEMVDLNERLNGLLQLSILKIIGFSDDAIRSAARDYGPLDRMLALSARRSEGAHR